MALRFLAQRGIQQLFSTQWWTKTSQSFWASEVSTATAARAFLEGSSSNTRSRVALNYLNRRTFCTKINQEGGKEASKTSSSKPNSSASSGFTIHTSQPRGGAKRSSNRNVAMYAVATLVAVGGLSYAAVPLYKMFCAATGYAGTTKVADSKNRAKIVYDHPIKIRFTSQVSDTLPWSFKPVQREMVVLPGEKALAFYVATNHATEPLVGVATYNVVPDLAGAYFNKIQCFCFDEQRLNPGETVNMPIHFFVDPSIEDDKILRGIHEITLSYTFFLAEDQSSEWWEEEREKHAKPTSL